MSMPAKNSRSIRVNGRDYRWTVSPDSGCLWVIVDPDKGRGQRVEARFDHGDRAITPRTARSVILDAFRCGWRPDDVGLPPLRLEGEPLRARID